MQGPTGEDESMAPDDNRKSKVNVLWAIPVTIGGYIVGFSLVSLLLDRELFLLKGLHLSIQILHKIAEEAGTRGIKLENRYNDIVNTMH